jgi:hypothetical protein
MDGRKLIVFASFHVCHRQLANVSHEKGELVCTKVYTGYTRKRDICVVIKNNKQIRQIKGRGF